MPMLYGPEMDMVGGGGGGNRGGGVNEKIINKNKTFKAKKQQHGINKPTIKLYIKNNFI
jgi:hypothetical protein